jgi:hypothetical protein
MIYHIFYSSIGATVRKIIEENRQKVTLSDEMFKIQYKINQCDSSLAIMSKVAPHDVFDELRSTCPYKMFTSFL